MTCYLGRSSRAPNTVFRLYRECTAPETRYQPCPEQQRVWVVREAQVGDPASYAYWGG